LEEVKLIFSSSSFLLLLPWAVLGRGQPAGEGVACPDFEFFFCSEKTEMMLVVPSERTFFFLDWFQTDTRFFFDNL